MQRNRPRLLPLFIAFIVVILIIIAIVSIGRAIFAPSNNSTDPASVDNGRAELLKTNVGHSVRLTTRGPIVAEENFSSYTIEISPNSRVMNVYTGYVDQIKDSSSNTNNTAAYEQFVYALDKADMMKGTEGDEAANDLRGICATGYVYDYAVLVDGSVVKHLWTSTCGGSKGTLQASTGQLNGLFFGQVPDSQKLIPFKQNRLTL